MNDNLSKNQRNNRNYLELAFSSIQFLCRQGLAIGGKEDFNSIFLQQLKCLMWATKGVYDLSKSKGYITTSTK